MMITKKGEGGRSRGKLEAEKDEALQNIIMTIAMAMAMAMTMAMAMAKYHHHLEYGMMVNMIGYRMLMTMMMVKKLMMRTLKVNLVQVLDNGSDVTEPTRVISGRH